MNINPQEIATELYEKINGKVETKTYTKGGKGRKECPQCNVFVGARTTLCNCGHKFKRKLIEPPKPKKKKKTIEIFDTPHQDRKLCPDCEKFVNKKEKKCACGHKFKLRKEKEKKPIKTNITDEVEQEAKRFAAALGQTGMTVLTPACQCPIRLKGIDKDIVCGWVENVLNAGFARGFIYSVPALCYFVREFYDYGTEDFFAVCNIIKECVDEKVYANI